MPPLSHRGSDTCPFFLAILLLKTIKSLCRMQSQGRKLAGDGFTRAAKGGVELLSMNPQVWPEHCPQQ